MKTTIYIIGASLFMTTPAVIITLVACNPEMDALLLLLSGIGFLGSMFGIHVISKSV